MIISEKLKLKLLIIFGFLSILGLYFFSIGENKLLSNSGSAKNHSVVKIDQLATDHDLKEAATTDHAAHKEDGSKQSQSKTYETLMGSVADAAEVKAWYATRGLLFLSNAEKEYTGYSQETLEKLSENGDMRAMQVLAKMYLDNNHFKQYGFIPAQTQYWKAATYGSTEAIIQLAAIHKVLAYDMVDVNADKTTDVLQSKLNAAFEVLALYRVAELRGDLWSGENPSSLFKELNHLDLTSQDQITIEHRANEILADLVIKREEIGLGSFDNSTPESVKKFFEKLKH